MSLVSSPSLTDSPESLVEGVETLAARAARELRDAIIRGELAPYERIHLNDASCRLGMSHVPIREALRSLASEGLVVQLPQRGFRVSPVSVADLEDTYRLRIRLDPMATDLAVPRLGSGELAELRASFTDLMEALRTSDWEAHRIHHRRFHFGIYNSCGSPWLLRVLGMLWDNSVRYQLLSAPHRGTVDERVQEHRAILEACEAGDPSGAAKLMRRHLTVTPRTLRDLVDSFAGSAE